MRQFKFDISLSTIEHLGVNLYSSLPAVLSEIVANAYDADARNVEIKKDENNTITILDDGIGMNEEDVQSKYLTVGYKRRKKSPQSPNGRKVMGRKGVGKLSLFAIAHTIKVITKKTDSNIIGLEISYKDILQCAEEEKDYCPKEIPELDISKYGEHFDKNNTGTAIILGNLQKKRLVWENSKEAIAIRFTCLSDDFSVKVNNEEISYEDRNYFTKLQFCWVIQEARIAKEISSRLPENKVCLQEKDCGFYGWIGSFKQHNKDRNKISLIIRNKIAVENILDALDINQVGADYLVGEIHVDYLDNDEDYDIATTNRQGLIEDDEEFKNTKEKLGELIKKIAREWSKKRSERVQEDVFNSLPPVKEWYNTLDKNTQKKAHLILGKINTLKITPEEKKNYIKAGVLATEKSKFSTIFDNLDNITKQSLDVVKEMLEKHDEWEKAYFYEITQLRIKVIDDLQNKVEKSALEKVVQKHIYEHLWLLDPAWERATEDRKMELTFKDQAKFSQEEKNSRIDIYYRVAGAEHVIVELKRPDASIKYHSLLEQIDKYKSGLGQILTGKRAIHHSIKSVILIGSESYTKIIKEIPTFDNDLNGRSAVIHSYESVIENAKRRYGTYLEKSDKAKRLIKLIDEIQNL